MKTFIEALLQRLGLIESEGQPRRRNPLLLAGEQDSQGIVDFHLGGDWTRFDILGRDLDQFQNSLFFHRYRNSAVTQLPVRAKG